jgi:uncharacterized protein YxjI
MHAAFSHQSYLLRRQVFALTGKFRLYAPSGEMVMYSQQKMFKLKEDIRIYADEKMTDELLYIQARSILDFSAAYDVIDQQTGQKVCVWRRKGLRSMLRDEWELLDQNDAPIGVMLEDNMMQALLRRFVLGSWLPQNYDLIAGGQRAVDVKQRFNPFRYELNIELLGPGSSLVDARMAIAGAILLATIEGRQE